MKKDNEDTVKRQLIVASSAAVKNRSIKYVVLVDSFGKMSKELNKMKDRKILIQRRFDEACGGEKEKSSKRMKRIGK